MGHDSQRRDKILLSLPHRNWAIFTPFWVDFPTELRSEPGEKGRNPLEKIQNNRVELAHRNCRFLSLVMAEGVLTFHLDQKAVEGMLSLSSRHCPQKRSIFHPQS